MASAEPLPDLGAAADGGNDHALSQTGQGDVCSAGFEDGESLADLDRKQKQLSLEKTLFTCASCGAGSNVSTDRGDARKDLRLLSCLHSVCRDCLISSCVRADGLAVCPLCMETTELPVIGWVDALPRNYWFLRRAENQVTPDAEPECGECAEGESADKIFGVCVDCNELLCEVHWLAHQKGRRTKSHKLSKDVDGFSALSRNATTISRSTRVPCSVHTQHDVNGFCKTCNEMVCKVCQEQGHRHHDIDPEFCTDKVEVQRRDLETEVEKSSAGLEACEASIADLTARIDKANLKAEAASKDVTTSVQRFVDDLRKEEKLTLHHIDEARWSLQKELEEKLEQKKAAKCQLERARLLTQESLHGNGDRAQLLHVSETLRKNLDQGNSKCSGEVDLSTLPSPGAIRDGSRKFDDRVRFLHAKLLAGSRHAAQPTDERCPIKCVEGPFVGNIPAIHQTTSQFVQVADSAAKVQAALEDPFGKSELCRLFRWDVTPCTGNVEVNAANVSHVEICFQPKLPGEHKLHVTHNDRHVHGSPSTVLVRGYPFRNVQIDHGALEGEEPPYIITNVTATCGSLFVKCGLLVPKVPESAEEKSLCTAGVSVVTQKVEEEQGSNKKAYVHDLFWQADGKFFSVAEQGLFDPELIKLEGDTHAWKDYEVMQLELDGLGNDSQWTLKLNHVCLGTSVIAKVPAVKRKILGAKVCICHPANYPVFILPAFY